MVSLTSRSWWRTQLTNRVFPPLYSLTAGHKLGAPVVEEDFDSLLLLDACRADSFESVTDTSEFDRYRRRRSSAERTDEWLASNFLDEAFPDTVYVTGSPQVSRVVPGSFHELVEAWDEAYNEETSAIMPKPISSRAREVNEEFPNKRLIVHFMQPHIPFVPDDDLRFRDWWDPSGGPENWEAAQNREGPKTIWEAVDESIVSRQQVIEGYEENLRFVLTHARDLAESLPGKTVITSDHGNLLGERVGPTPLRYYGHPRGFYHEKLLTVPWAVVETGERPEIVGDGIGSETEMDQEKIESRLKSLGYK